MKIDAILTCVNYDDYLKFSLPENVKHFDRFVVVTDAEDKATSDIVLKNDAICVIRANEDKFEANGAKGRAINDGLKALEPEGWVLHLDADIILPDNFREILEAQSLDEEKLYWVTRKQPRTEQQFAEYLKDKTTIKAWEGLNPEGSPDRWSGPFGYFQLFNIKSEVIKSSKTLYSEMDTPTAWIDKADEKQIDWKASLDVLHECVDGTFNRRWSKDQKVKLSDEFTVLHMPHGPCRINWSGRKSERFSFPESPAGFFQ